MSTERTNGVTPAEVGALSDAVYERIQMKSAPLSCVREWARITALPQINHIMHNNTVAVGLMLVAETIDGVELTLSDGEVFDLHSAALLRDEAYALKTIVRISSTLADELAARLSMLADNYDTTIMQTTVEAAVSRTMGDDAFDGWVNARFGHIKLKSTWFYKHLKEQSV